MSNNRRKENLIPAAHKLTTEERSRGGINSGESRRERKKAYEAAERILSGSLRSEDIPEGIDLKDADIITGIVAQLARKSLDGNVRAAELLLGISGDYNRRMELETHTSYEDESAREMEKYFARHTLVITDD